MAVIMFLKPTWACFLRERSSAHQAPTRHTVSRRHRSLRVFGESPFEKHTRSELIRADNGAVSAQCALPARSWVKTDNPIRRSDLPGDEPVAIYENRSDAAEARAYDARLTELDRQRAVEDRFKREFHGSIKEEEDSTTASAPPPPIFDAASQQWRSQPGDASFIGSENAFSYGGQVTSFRSAVSYLKPCGCLFGPCEHQQ